MIRPLLNLLRGPFRLRPSIKLRQLIMESKIKEKRKKIA